MAFRTWGRLLLTALGVSVLAGAGQLGVAYGFGIVRLTGAFTGTTVNQWPAQLVWVGWFAANAAVAGAVLTGRIARRDAPAASTGRQLAIGGAAALGATVIAPLCMQPARAAELISIDPVWAVGICAVLGAVIGAGAATAVLLRPELGWNMAAVGGAVWLLALISVLPSLGMAGPLPTVRLGVLEPSWLNDAAAQQLALLLLPTVALLAGAATAGFARWRGQAPLVSGATGVAGPVLVAFAYLTAGPGDAVDRYQASPYYGSLIAILAGALGAAAAALLRWPATARAADPQAIEPSDILRPLPASPALPGTASAGSTNDRDTVARTDARLVTTEPPVGQPTGAELAGANPGPRAAGGSDGVRTVPAHWDWPATTASGQHGPAPAAPATPAAWRTDPTTAFSTEALTRRSNRDDVTSPADAAPPASDVSNSTEATPTSTTAGPADAATPAAGPDDAPTGSATTGTGDRPAGDTSKDTPTTEPTSAGPTSAVPPSSATTSASTTSAGPTSAAPTSAGPTSAGTAGAGAGDAGTADAPVTLKPRRTRKPKASPDVTTSPTPDDTPSAESAATDETTTGRARKVTRPTKSADRTTPGKATGTPARSTENQDSRSGLTTEADPIAGSAASAEAAAPASPIAATSSTGTPATPTAATDAKARAAEPPRTPATTATTSTGPAASSPAEPASGSAAAGADETGSARPAIEDGSTAGLFGITADSDPGRWTPTAPAWPATSAWPVPPQAAEPGPAPSETAAGPDEPTPRPRHRAPLPDLSRASTWDAFNTARRAGPARSPNTARSTSAGSTAASESAAPAEPASTTTSPVVQGQAAPAEPVAPTRRSSPTAAPVVPGQAGAPSDTRTADPTTTGDPTTTTDPATTDDEPAAGAVAEQPSRRGRLGGLFRRNRSRAEEASQEPSAETEPLPTQDEEFVDWVAGLSKPVSDNEPEQESGRRSLRSTGRHYRD